MSLTFTGTKNDIKIDHFKESQTDGPHFKYTSNKPSRCANPVCCGNLRKFCKYIFGAFFLYT